MMEKNRQIHTIIFYFFGTCFIISASDCSQSFENKSHVAKGQGSPRRPRELSEWNASAYAQGIAFWNLQDRSASERKLLERMQQEEKQPLVPSFLDSDEKDDATIVTTFKLPSASNKPSPLLQSQCVKSNTWVLEPVEDEQY